MICLPGKPSGAVECLSFVVGAVPHSAYRELSDERLTALVAPGGTLADLKGIWRDRRLDPAIDRWTL